MKKILIVDDEPHIVELVRVSLEDCDYELHDAVDGEEALQMAREILPNLILLDVMLPRMDGFDVCRQLKEDPRTRHIEVILLTAKSQDDDVRAGMRAGADAYITKPFSPMRLLAEVQTRLSGQPAT